MTTQSKPTSDSNYEQIKKAVNEVLDERAEDKLHQQVHGRLKLNLSKKAGRLPQGKVVMAKCGICEQVFEQPLIWTFAFPYAEYFCMNEYNWFGMLGAGHRTEATPELLKTKKLYNRRWGQVKKHLVKSRFYRKDCDKCSHDEAHCFHLTDEEKAKAEWADNKLKEYAGVES